MLLTRVPLSDAALLRSFAEHSFRLAYEHLNDPVHFENYCAKAFHPEQVEAELLHPFSAFWFAHVDGQLAGYLKLNFDHHPAELASEHTVHVERIYIHPDFQGRGIGAKMLDFAEEQARNAGAQYLWLSVWKKNPRAVRFYERCGYQVFGTEVFVVGEDAQLDWLMQRKVENQPL